MKNYKELKKENLVRLEEHALGVRILQTKFSDTGKTAEEEVLITNSAHQDDLERDLLNTKQRLESELADVEVFLAGIKALKPDVVKIEKETAKRKEAETKEVSKKK